MNKSNAFIKRLYFTTFYRDFIKKLNAFSKFCPLPTYN